MYFIARERERERERDRYRKHDSEARKQPLPILIFYTAVLHIAAPFSEEDGYTLYRSHRAFEFENTHKRRRISLLIPSSILICGNSPSMFRMSRVVPEDDSLEGSRCSGEVAGASPPRRSRKYVGETKTIYGRAFIFVRRVAHFKQFVRSFAGARVRPSRKHNINEGRLSER